MSPLSPMLVADDKADDNNSMNKCLLCNRTYPDHLLAPLVSSFRNPSYRSVCPPCAYKEISKMHGVRVYPTAGTISEDMYREAQTRYTDILPIRNVSDIRENGPCYDPVTGLDIYGSKIKTALLDENWVGTALDILGMEGVPVCDRIWVVTHTNWMTPTLTQEVFRLFTSYLQTVFVSDRDFGYFTGYRDFAYKLQPRNLYYDTLIAAVYEVEHDESEKETDFLQKALLDILISCFTEHYKSDI